MHFVILQASGGEERVDEVVRANEILSAEKQRLQTSLSQTEQLVTVRIPLITL